MRLYSSAFLSLILVLLALLQKEGVPLEFSPMEAGESFRTIQKESTEQSASEVPVSMVLNTDFTCAPCAEYAKEVLPKIRTEYVETGKIELQIRVFPLFAEDEAALRAASSAKCAAEQNKFREMHDKLFEYGGTLSLKAIHQAGGQSGLEEEALKKCLNDPAIRQAVLNDRKEALTQTDEVPVTLIGPYRLIGNQPYENVKWIIRKVLQSNS